MSEYSFTYRNDNFSLEKANNATLFIKAGKTDLSFLIAEDGQVLAWKDKCPLDELTGETELNTVLSAPYKNVVTGLVPDALTLLPAELYQPENVSDYARYLDIKANEQVYATKLDGQNQLIYKVDNASSGALIVKFGIDTTVPADRGWINAIAQTDPSNYAIYLDITDEQVSLLGFNGGQVRYYNCFKTGGIDDVLYYSLFATGELELNPNYISLIVSGRIAAGDLDKLGEFFRVVKYNDLKLLEAPTVVPSHQILSLAALA